MSEATKQQGNGSTAAAVEQAKPKGLYAKLVAAAAAAGTVGEEGRHPQGWNYARAADVIREAQKALSVAGLAVVPNMGEVETIREYQTSNGAHGVMVRVEMRYAVVDPETGETTELRYLGTGSDAPGDKAIYKAVTGAAKYFYAGLLGIPFGEDPEVRGVGDDATAANSDRQSEPPPARLKPERVERIIGAFGALKLKVRDINLMLGAAGANSLPANTAQAIKAHIASLGEVEADTLEAELEKRAAAESQDADAEQPDEGATEPPAEASQEGGEARADA